MGLQIATTTETPGGGYRVAFIAGRGRIVPHNVAMTLRIGGVDWGTSYESHDSAREAYRHYDSACRFMRNGADPRNLHPSRLIHRTRVVQ